jgi:hypothetical protein
MFNFIKRYIVRLGLSLANKDEVISWSMTMIKEPLERYFDEIKWEKSDADALQDYLKSESGKRFLAVITENKNRALQGVLSAKDPNEVEKIKGQATAWIALRSNLEVLRKYRDMTQTDKMTPEQIEAAFSRVVSSSIQVTNSNHRQN